MTKFRNIKNQSLPGIRFYYFQHSTSSGGKVYNVRVNHFVCFMGVLEYKLLYIIYNISFLSGFFFDNIILV